MRTRPCIRCKESYEGEFYGLCQACKDHLNAIYDTEIMIKYYRKYQREKKRRDRELLEQ